MPAFERGKLVERLRDVVVKSYNARHSKPDIYRNTLDCFSAIVDAKILQKSIDEWVKDVEQTRVTQKTLQNEIGNIHTMVLSTIPGWRDMKVGEIVDLENSDRKIIVEMKNKHNTTKGNHKKDIYDDLAGLLEGDYAGYTGYYVEVLPKNRESYDRPFTPPDNTNRSNRPARADIRIIDGKSFYTLVTGHDDALEQFYSLLPGIIDEILTAHIPDFEPKPLGDMSAKIFRQIYSSTPTKSN